MKLLAGKPAVFLLLPFIKIILYKTFTEPFLLIYIFLLSSYHVENQTPKGQPSCKPH